MLASTRQVLQEEKETILQCWQSPKALTGSCLEAVVPGQTVQANNTDSFRWCCGIIHSSSLWQSQLLSQILDFLFHHQKIRLSEDLSVWELACVCFFSVYSVKSDCFTVLLCTKAEHPVRSCDSSPPNHFYFHTRKIQTLLGPIPDDRSHTEQ